jgi:hypothetical protein
VTRARKQTPIGSAPPLGYRRGDTRVTTSSHSARAALTCAVGEEITRMDTNAGTSYPTSGAAARVVHEDTIEYGFINKLEELKYEIRKDIRDRAALEKNFRQKFEELNRCRL